MRIVSLENFAVAGQAGATGRGMAEREVMRLQAGRPAAEEVLSRDRAA